MKKGKRIIIGRSIIWSWNPNRSLLNNISFNIFGIFWSIGGLLKREVEDDEYFDNQNSL